MNDLYWVCSYTMEDDLIYVESPKGYTDTLQITVNERECYIKYYNDYGAFRKK